MIFGLAFHFAITAFAVVVNVFFAAWLANFFLSEDKAKIAGFSFVLGGGVLGGAAPEITTIAPLADRMAILIGGVVGLAFAWAQFFWRRKQNV